MSSGYSGRNWECPFFRWDEKKGGRVRVHCEGGMLTLPPKELQEYIGRYCGSLAGWKSCPLAQALWEYYEEKT